MTTRLTLHFTLEDFVRSDYATEHGIDNTLPEDLMDKARNVAQMGERVRTFLSSRMGKEVPILTSSVWRCPALDMAIRKRPKTGDHARMEAMDFTAPAFGTPYEIAKALAPMISILGIGQLIYECPTPGREWVHISARLPEKVVNRVITISPAGPEIGIQVIEG
jgi:zinc D-Ala-D-Ala carboxypeptidase